MKSKVGESFIMTPEISHALAILGQTDSRRGSVHSAMLTVIVKDYPGLSSFRVSPFLFSPLCPIPLEGGP
jgi:hypothetical protein